MQKTMVAGVALAVLTLPVSANDTTAQLGTGGLIFVQNYTVQMLSEDLYISPDEVRVKYEFKNTADTAEHVLVAFPMPDIEGSGDFMVAIPTDDTENLFGFETTFNGEPVDAELHQYAFAAGIDQSEFLRDLDVPLAPFGMETQEALNGLDDADKVRLQELGLVMAMEYDAGNGMQTDYVPIWTLRSTYSWEAEFPAGEIVDVEHSYQPSVGGTVALTYLSEGYEDYDPAAEALEKYCTDATFIRASKREQAKAEAAESGYPVENWISYVWSTGANWYGSIGKFTLTIDKGAPENLVSFCWDGDVEKISDTAFRMEATDWYPPYDRELEILIAVHNEPME
ncbi:MAG: hypothetical protein JWR75_137 [Devosia sp.]|nr:hypothetical protein [Devosia sp.]